MLSLDRGLELAIAAFVVSLLLFARYYLLPVHPLGPCIGRRFSMYSCFYVINDTMFEKLAERITWPYGDTWTYSHSWPVC